MSTIKNKINKYINKEGKLATPGYFISELLGDIDEKIDNLDEKTSTKIKQNSNNLKTIRANMSALESEISSNVNSNISSLSSRISQLKSEVETNTKKNEKIISSALTDLDERINWLMDFIIKKVAVISARINVTDVTIPPSPPDTYCPVAGLYVLILTVWLYVFLNLAYMVRVPSPRYV